jgi:hypothetical protein
MTATSLPTSSVEQRPDIAHRTSDLRFFSSPSDELVDRESHQNAGFHLHLTQPFVIERRVGCASALRMSFNYGI